MTTHAGNCFVDFTRVVGVPGKTHHNDQDTNLLVANEVVSKKFNKGGIISHDSARKLKRLLLYTAIILINNCSNIIRREAVALEVDVESRFF